MSTDKRNRNGSRRIAELPEIRRRRRLENLLYNRKRLAQLVAECRAHGLDEHLELYLLPIEVEQVMADEFPNAYEDNVGLWAEEEIAAEHHPRFTTKTCSLCHAIAIAIAIAKHHGGSLSTPPAA